MWTLETHVAGKYYSSSPEWSRSPQQFDTAAAAAQELALVVGTLAEHGYVVWGRVVPCHPEVAS